MISNLALKYYKSKLLRRLDSEMFMIPNLAQKLDVAIDVGANIGFYSYYLSKIFKTVHSFEPIENISKDLVNYTSINKNISLHNYALSDTNESALISVPLVKNKNVLNYGYASLTNKFDKTKEIKIQKKTLDSFNIENIDFIKIDVEGHENEVLEGGINSIKTCMPLILIEIEERHTGIKAKETIKRLISLGYDCIYQRNGRFEKYENFNFYEDQNKAYLNTKKYICNFFFVPKKI